MLFDDSGSLSRWAPEHHSWSFALNDGQYYGVALVPGTAVQGVRKVKNFQISLHLTCDDTRVEHACTWVLYVQKELQSGDQICAPLLPIQDGGMTEVLDHPECVIACGMVGNLQIGRPTFCPLSRLLESGDSLCCAVVGQFGDDQTIGVYMACSFAICYA
jgi:hypothetical protein